jgi:DNA repair protein SbcC/Rad50
MLQKLGAANVDEAVSGFSAARGFIDKLKSKTMELSSLPSGEERELILAKIEEFKGQDIRKSDELDKELAILVDQKRTTERELDKATYEIEQWEGKFDSHINLVQIMAGRMNEKKVLEEKMGGLSSLPAQYQDVDSFLSSLNSSRKERDELQSREKALVERMNSATLELPESSAEELTTLLDDAKMKFGHYLNQAGQLKQIMSIFEDTCASMENSAVSPLLESFSAKLGHITGSKYDSAVIGADIEVSIGNGGKSLPTSLLSSGTLDSVSLAFRLALTEELMDGVESLTVLDDCLVNMDPDRQKNAASMIQEHANGRQVIFTTCNPETARMLGGNIIELF